jgi:hypothetical protein
LCHVIPAELVKSYYEDGEEVGQVNDGRQMSYRSDVVEEPKADEISFLMCNCSVVLQDEIRTNKFKSTLLLYATVIVKTCLKSFEK